MNRNITIYTNPFVTRVNYFIDQLKLVHNMSDREKIIFNMFEYIIENKDKVGWEKHDKLRSSFHNKLHELYYVNNLYWVNNTYYAMFGKYLEEPFPNMTKDSYESILDHFSEIKYRNKGDSPFHNYMFDEYISNTMFTEYELFILGQLV